MPERFPVASNPLLDPDPNHPLRRLRVEVFVFVDPGRPLAAALAEFPGLAPHRDPAPFAGHRFLVERPFAADLERLPGTPTDSVPLREDAGGHRLRVTIETLFGHAVAFLELEDPAGNPATGRDAWRAAERWARMTRGDAAESYMGFRFARTVSTGNVGDRGPTEAGDRPFENLPVLLLRLPPVPR